MQAETWLALTDYASKYRISVSTLRRRIKHGQIQFRFEDGKYMLLDSAPAPSSSIPYSMPEATFEEPPTQAAQPSQNEEPILSSASRLLSELKRAYMNVLHEKEEQIIQLKEEVSDLKTLVRVLEDDNDRLRRYAGESEISR